MRTSTTTHTAAFVEAFVAFVWFCVKQFNEQDASAFQAMIRHWDGDDGPSDYQTGQRIIAVPNDEVYDPTPTIMAEALELVGLHWRAVREQVRFVECNHEIRKDKLADWVAQKATEVAKPIFGEFRDRTKWNECPLQYERAMKPLAQARALLAIWPSVRWAERH